MKLKNLDLKRKIKKILFITFNAKRQCYPFILFYFIIIIIIYF